MITSQKGLIGVFHYNVLFYAHTRPHPIATAEGLIELPLAEFEDRRTPYTVLYNDIKKRIIESIGIEQKIEYNYCVLSQFSLLYQQREEVL